MPSPRVSICIPVYNTERFIADAVTTALAQTYRDFEIVIVDNASTDATPRGARARHGPAHQASFRNERNIGAQANFNRAVSLARGEYLKVLCADDVLYPTCLEQQVAVFEADPRARSPMVELRPRHHRRARQARG